MRLSKESKKIDTLKNNRHYSYVQKTGQKISTKGFLLIAQHYTPPITGEKADVAIYVGYTVTKKMGNSVTRNRIKRRLREVVSDVLPSLGQDGYSYVLIAKHHTLDRPYASLIKDMQYALHTVKESHVHAA